ncbi:MAG: hypothetical protein KTR33_07890 [Gammaproteobacteria bacterium]|nr:hypothetical protein [Gammaproteobacteria bacterium]
MSASQFNATSAAELVNLEQYPLPGAAGDAPDTAGEHFLENCRRDYLQSGLCILPDFIHPQALNALADEANQLAPEAYFCKSTHNAYLDDGASDLPADDVTNQQEHTYVGSVAFDQIHDTSLLRTLYQWDPLKSFIGAVLGKTSFYRFADPFGACSINVFVDGGEHGWHFDESEYTVTLMLQRPKQGGSFEYVPLIRDQPDEKTIVRNTLEGDRTHVAELPFTAGTLLIFGGRQTLHRVTRVTGDTPRLVPVLCYAEKPGMTNSESVRELFWGRRGPDSAHA